MDMGVGVSGRTYGGEELALTVAAGRTEAAGAFGGTQRAGHFNGGGSAGQAACARSLIAPDPVPPPTPRRQ